MLLEEQPGILFVVVHDGEPVPGLSEFSEEIRKKLGSVLDRGDS